MVTNKKWYDEMRIENEIIQIDYVMARYKSKLYTEVENIWKIF